MPSSIWGGMCAHSHALTCHIHALTGRSNGIRFSITSLAPPRARLLVPIYSTRAGISLFDALTPDAHGGLVFPPDTISSVSSTLSHFTRIAQLHHVAPSNTMIFATEAMRRAANAADMLAAIGSATGGLGVQILEPSVETLFGAVMGSRSGLTNVEGGALFLDLGGGSVQMTWVDTSLDHYEVKAAMAGNSMPYGAAKLTRILDGVDAALRAAELDKLKASMQAAFDNLCSVFPKLRSIRDARNKGQKDVGVDVYMCGGGFRGYGSMLMHNDAAKPYPISSIGTYTVDGAAFKQVNEMIRVNQNYDGKIFGMSKRRRCQFDAITTVIRAFISAVPYIRRVTFCKGSNRDGALMMKLPREIREGNPLEVLASVGKDEKPLFDAVLRTLFESLPKGLNTRTTPTVLSDGLGYLFVREIWSRGGFDFDTNVSFALHNALARDSDTPGLTHLARAALGITVAARWGFGVGPADGQLVEGLQSILTRHNADAAFWAKYIGAIANIITHIFPVRPHDAGDFERSIRYIPMFQFVIIHPIFFARSNIMTGSKLTSGSRRARKTVLS